MSCFKLVCCAALLGSCWSPAHAQDNAVWADFDGDNVSDLTVWRPSDGGWYVIPSSGTCPSEMTPFLWGCFKQWGLPGDIPVSGDYAGDGKNDYAIWRPSTEDFWIAYSVGGHFVMSFAGYFDTGVRPSPGDYSGDGRTDIAFLYPYWVDRTFGKLKEDWLVRDSWTGGISILGGSRNRYPAVARPNVSADYDGDGVADRATVLDGRRKHTWVVYGIGSRSFRVGRQNVLWVAGDYTGDGQADYTFWNRDTGNWTIYPRGQSGSNVVQWGLQGDIPVSGDFDGDGTADPTVWRPSSGTFFVLPTSGECPGGMSPHGPGCMRQWGLPGDIPIPRTSFP